MLALFFAGTAILLTGVSSIALASGHPAARPKSRTTTHPRSKRVCKPRKLTKPRPAGRCAVKRPESARKKASCRKAKLSKAKRTATCPKPRSTPHATTPAHPDVAAPMSSPTGPSQPTANGLLPVTIGYGPEVVGFGPERAPPTEAALEADIDPEGTDVKYHFEYGLTTGYGTNIPMPDGDAGSGYGPVEVKLQVTGLTPVTTYHERIVAEYAGNVYRGRDFAFTTGPYAPELESYVVITDVSATEATLRGAVYPGYTNTTADFRYGARSVGEHGTTEVNLGAGDTRVPIESTLTGLNPSTHYHFLLEAANRLGTVHGMEYIFETLSG